MTNPGTIHQNRNYPGKRPMNIGKAIFSVIAIAALCTSFYPPSVAAQTAASSQTETAALPVTSIKIHFVDDSGAPIPNLRASASSFTYLGSRLPVNGQPLNGWTQTTDTNGDATFSDLPQGCWMQLSILDDNYALPDRAPTIPISRESTTLTLQVSQTSTISGIITCAGHPAAGIGVSINGWLSRGSAVTDQSGKYAITHLHAGHYNITTNDSDHAFDDWAMPTSSIDVSCGQKVFDRNMDLNRGSILTGKVTDKLTGAPLAHASVSIYYGRFGSENLTNAVTGQDGVYQLHLSPGPYCVVVWGLGSITNRYVHIENGESATINLQAASYGPLNIRNQEYHGTIVAANGQPAAGAQVSEITGADRPTQTQTNALGRFTLPATGSPALLLTRSGDAGSATQATPAEEVRMRLSPYSFTTFNGKVIDQNSRPAAGALVTLLTDTPSGKSATQETFTDIQGRYRFDHVFINEHYTVTADQTGYAGDKIQNVYADPGKTGNLPEMSVIINNSFVGGTILNEQGKPAPNVDVSERDLPSAHVTTDKDGRFLIFGVPPGQTTVLAVATDGTWDAEHLQSGKRDNIISLPYSQAQRKRLIQISTKQSNAQQGALDKNIAR